MKLANLFLCLLVISLSFTSAFSQIVSVESATASTESVKENEEIEKKAIAILEQVVNEAAYLKLPENRALVFASAGDLIWKRDEKERDNYFVNPRRRSFKPTIHLHKAMLIRWIFRVLC